MISHVARFLFMALTLLVAPYAMGGEASDDRSALDMLFAKLRVAPDATTAHEIDRQIWTYWTTPSDPILKERMAEIMVSRLAGEVKAAVGLLDALVEDYPDYAEAWNQRATLHYLLGEFELSLADCEHVLALEPRHFGALAGRALIYLQMGNRPLALRDMSAALAIHPYLVERRLFPELGEAATQI